MLRHSRLLSRLRPRSVALGLSVLLLAGVLAVAGAQSPPVASGTAALAHVATLSQQIGPRPAGSPAYIRATEYVTEQFQRLGYRVEPQAFPFQFFDEPYLPILTVVAPVDLVLHPATMIYSTATPEDGVEAELVDVGLGREEDLRGKRLDGKVAFAGRGQIRFSEKASSAAAAGASAIIIFNNQPGPAQTGTLLTPSRIPVVMIPYGEGLRLGAWLAAGPVRVHLVIRTVTERRSSANVIAVKPGTSSPQEVVVVGAHLDTVPPSPGANDNASGVAAVLEVARLLAEVPTARTIHFVAFGAEELGLIGSSYYVANRTLAVTGMVNLDMVGHGSQVLISNSAGTGSLLDVAERVAGRLALPVRRLRLGSSDHESFERGGVPVVFIHTGDDDVIHTPQDVYARIDPNLLAQAAALAAALIVEIAR